MTRKDIGLRIIKGPHPGTWNFQGGAKWTIYAPCKNIVMLSNLGDPVPPFSCKWSYMKRKVIGLESIEGHYPGTWKFQGGILKINFALCQNMVILSCLVLEIRSLHFYVYCHMKRKNIGFGSINFLLALLYQNFWCSCSGDTKVKLASNASNASNKLNSNNDFVYVYRLKELRKSESDFEFNQNTNLLNNFISFIALKIYKYKMFCRIENIQETEASLINNVKNAP